MPKKIFCPVDGSEMEHTGDHGIVDYDGNWDAQASRYECADKTHTIFVVESDFIVEPGEPAFEAAEQEILDALRKAAWDLVSKSVQLRTIVMATDLSIPRWREELGEPITSLENLRSELAKRAVEAFKDEAEESIEGHNYENVEYEYIHALEDVDEVLEDEEFNPRLEEIGWLKPKK